MTARFAALLAGALGLAAPAAAGSPSFLISNDDDRSIIDTNAYREIRRARRHAAASLRADPQQPPGRGGQRRVHDLVFLDPLTADLVRRVARVPVPYPLGFSLDQQ